MTEHHDVDVVLGSVGYFYPECSCGWRSVEGYVDMGAAADAADVHTTTYAANQRNT